MCKRRGGHGHRSWRYLVARIGKFETDGLLVVAACADSPYAVVEGERRNEYRKYF